MPILTQPFSGTPDGMNVALPAQEIADTEARYIQDALLDFPGLIRRRGPMRPVSGVATLPRKATGLVVTINPAGNDRYGALTGDVANGYLSALADDLASVVDLTWPHSLPTDPAFGSATAYRLVHARPGSRGGTWIGTASDYSRNPNHALALWKGGNKADYSTGTISVARGSATVTGVGTTWVGNAVPGMFLFASTDAPDLATDTLIGTVLAVNSNTQIILDAGSPYPITAKAYALRSIRGFIPKVSKGRITADTASTTVSGGATKFVSQGLGTGSWNLYRANDMSWIGKVASVQSEIGLTLAANAAVAVADQQYIAIRSDWAAADKSIDLTGSVNKVGWLNAIFAERQWYANNGAAFDKTYRLWFSDTLDPECVDLSADGDWIPISSTSDIPEPIRGICPTYNALLVFKENETFGVFGNSPSSFSARKLEDDGLLSTMSIQSWGAGAVWAGRDGIYFFDGITVTNLTQNKLGDVWKNSTRSIDPLRHRMWSMVTRNHYFLFVENLTPTVSVRKGVTSTTPTHWVVCVNLETKAATLMTNLAIRGAVSLPETRGQGEWYVVNSDLTTPAGLAATASTTGGSLATATYFYKVTALNSIGETTGSAEVSAAVTGPTGSVTLTWNAVVGASSYRVYRGTATGAQNVYYTTTTNAYTDTGAANTGGTVPTTDSSAKGVICEANALFDEEAVDNFTPDVATATGPDFYYESKKFNVGNDVRLKRFKQLAIHYLAQGGALKVDTVLGLNDIGSPLTANFPASVMTWSVLSSTVSTWSNVAAQFSTWNDLIQGVFQPKRVRFLKKTHHLSFRLYQENAQMARIRIGPFHIGFKLMREGRV